MTADDRCTGADAQKATASSSNFADLRFADLAKILPKDAHVIFNVSKVFQARMFARRVNEASNNKDNSNGAGGTETPVEVMFLNVCSPATDASEALQLACQGQQWRCMIRQADIIAGDLLQVVGGATAAGAPRLKVSAPFPKG